METIDINKVVLFHNPLQEDFTFHWDKAPYQVPALTTVHFPYFLARHGAKHLVDYIILHPEFWKELGLKRNDDGSRKNKDGEPIISELENGREDIEKIILVHEAPEVKKKEKQINKPEEKEKEFPDLPKQ